VVDGFATLNAIRSAPQYSVSEPELVTFPLLSVVTSLQKLHVFEQEGAVIKNTIKHTA
jgi:hypothetical protein